MACAKPKVETFFNNERNASITKTCIENNCKVSYKNETNTGEIIRNIRQEQISIDKINSASILRLHISCGSYCSATSFVGKYNIDILIPNVIAISSNNCIFYAKDNDYLAFKQVFSNKDKLLIESRSDGLNFDTNQASIMSSIDTEKSSFDKNGDFRLEYFTRDEVRKTLNFNKPCH